MSELIKNDDFWRQWLEKFKSYKGLWDTEHEMFSKNSYKQKAWTELIEMARKVYPEADSNFIRRQMLKFIYEYKIESKKREVALENGINNWESKSFCYKILRTIYEKSEEEIKQQTFWCKFYKYYGAQKCLWDFENNKNLYSSTDRNTAWLRLTKFVQRLNPDASVESVKSRVRNSRAVYLREVRKIKDSNGEYIPTLFYFNILNRIYNGTISEYEESEEEVEETQNKKTIATRDAINIGLSLDKKLWRKVLKKYVSFKCLWDFENPKLYSIKEREAAWHKLLNIAKKSYSNVDVAYIKSRISNCRTAHQRELRKIALANERGITYKPKLFYCDILCALNQPEPNSIVFSSDESICEEIDQKDEMPQKQDLSAYEEELKQKGFIYAPLDISPKDYERKVWLQVIKKFVYCRCLWDVEHKDYDKQSMRDLAWAKLAEIARKGNTQANVAYVKKKISHCRTVYSRQLEKAKRARQSGDLFEITLFYFNALSPVYQKDFPIFDYNKDETFDDFDVDNSLNPTKNTYFPEDGGETENENEQTMNSVENLSIPESYQPHNENEYTEELESFMNALVCDGKGTNSSDLSNEYFIKEKPININRAKCKRKKQMKKSRDKKMKLSAENSKEFDNDGIFEERIAQHLNAMESDQFLLAEKLIIEVCTFGRLNELTKQSHIILKKK